MHDYKIRYRDGRTRQVTADAYGVYGDFFVFTRNRQDILSVAKADVESIGLAELADPESPEPVIA